MDEKDDLMARTMVENLSIGINPLTGRALPPSDCCANEVVQEALKAVLEHCSLFWSGREKRKRRLKRRKKNAEKLNTQIPGKRGPERKARSSMICTFGERITSGKSQTS